MYAYCALLQQQLDVSNETNTIFDLKATIYI